ncbi:MAG TPA: pilus assembly protein CpaB [Chloroflexus aurantiacus]|jgi:pilus assembly protein CpaB|uniref:SAF domain protein n=1 Tax=Chloroflexus aurantiacus (strain ATCC 29366 / DSM 635 / J-10-fl) TaxID=324602 RepID=A9WEA1_CHLAA|nr:MULTISPECIES: SAF domain-containing protein [Chloroflexus]ABY33761.1 SAF domain protein [Chloroflexus aurantiacus J-10-fl]RMG52785.1 MAG: pilus assembly protein CpaB [Chloroflexota bacterium]GIV94391.1 MAG: pilus assembly protein CpaB [Chloroflexus sp.]HBW68210.1 pilus assembly protein CpaB [Chloroflexus aurantiacus]
MRRGALLFLLIGLIVIIGGLAAFLLLRGGAATSTTSQTPEVPPPPTAVPLVSVVQARVDLEANTLLNDPSLLDVVEVPVTEFDEANEFSNINDVLGKLLINPVVAGQSIRKDNIREAGLAQRIPTAEPGQAQVKAYPLIVNSLSGVADQVAVNDFVDVIATFSVERQIIRPGPVQVITVNDVDQLVREYQYGENQTFFSTKTIIQRAQVLQIVRPALPAPTEGEETTTEAVTPPASSSLPQVDASGQPITGAQTAEGGATTPSTLTEGVWVVVLALTDQEIELLEFALQSQARIVLALRGANDDAIESTSGVTLDLLVREYGLPLPRPLPPRVYGEDEVFVPEPTPTPLP